MSYPKQIAIYCKGGIGKSTTTSNIAEALADKLLLKNGTGNLSSEVKI